MTISLYVHINDGEPFVGEIEEYPPPNATYVVIQNPRQRDGKDLRYLMEEVTTIMMPMWRITYIEVMPSDEEEDIFMPFRDS
jgi:hypothetical protein